MSEIIILCHLEHLAPYDAGSLRAYSLNISIAVGAATPLDEKTKRILRPWLANQITDVSVFVKDATPPITERVKVLPQTWRGNPIAFDAPQFTKRNLIIQQLKAEFDGCEAAPGSDCFVWKLPAESDAPVTENARKPWHTFVGQTAQLPTPIPQLLNLSLIFYFDNPNGKPIVAAPLLEFPAPAFTLMPKSDLTELPQMTGRETVKIWEYKPEAGLPTVNAYVEECPLRDAATTGAFLDLQTLWVKNPTDAANPDGFNFGEDWRAMLENRMADAFDLSRRIVELLRKVPANANDPDFLSKIRRMFLAALRDIIGIGINPAPNNEILLNFLIKPNLPTQPSRDLTEAQIIEIRSAVTTLFSDVDKWAKFVVDTLPSLSKLPALTDPRAITSIQDTVSELEQLHQAVLSEENLPALVKAQWRKISEITANQTVKSVLQAAIASPKLGDVNLRRTLALENLGVFWRQFVKSGLTDAASGKPKVKENFSCYFRAYSLLRFNKTDLSSLAADCPNLDDLKTEYARLAVSPPFAADDAILGELSNAIKMWSEQNFADKLVPQPLKSSVQQPVTEEFTEVPHAVTIMVAKLEADTGSGDPLASIAGVGILMREENSPNWQCLNMADARLRKNGGILENGEPLFDQPVLVASRLNYINDLRQSFVTYNNHPLAAKSPAAMLTKLDPLSNREPLKPARPEEIWETLVSYFYAKPQTHADARIPALKFGKNYQVLPFIVGNSGIVPKELARKTAVPNSPTITSSPAEINLAGFDASGLAANIRKFSYFRKVRIGHIRAFSLINVGSQKVEGTCLNLPPIPETVFPRLRDLKFGDNVQQPAPTPTPIPTPVPNPTASPFNQTQEKPLLLLSPFGAPNAVEQLTFYLRMPATDINTWDRWVAGGKIFNKPISGQPLKDLRTVVWKEHYRRLKASPQSEDCQVVSAADNPVIDEPAIELLFYAELEKFNDDGTWTEAKPAVPIPIAETPAATQPLAGVQTLPVAVTCKAIEAATEVFQNTGGALSVSLLKGKIYRLRISCCLPKDDYPQGSAAARFARIYRENLPSVPGRNSYKVSPFEMFIEVATDEIVPGTTDAEIARKTLAEWLTPNFERLPKDNAVPVNLKSDAVQVRFGKKLSDRFVEQTFPFAQKVELKRQMWRWQGRDTKPHPETKNSVAAAAEIDRWEAKEYGNRFDEDHVVINMDSKINDDRNIDASIAAGKRLFSYTEYLTGEKSKKEELRALHYRFKATMFSRYAGILPPEKASVSTVDWKSRFVPCRVKQLTDPPKLKLIFPLTQSFGASKVGTAGLLAVFDESWHEIGGIGEGLGIEVAQAADPYFPAGAVPDGAKVYFEIGLDPIVSGQAMQPTSVSFSDEDKRGPVGHTFDRSDDNPFFTATSFVVPAPSVVGAQPQINFGAWGMCKIRFKRIVQVGTTVEAGQMKQIRLESKFTEPFWVQYLPEFSLFREITGVGENEIKDFSDLRLQPIPSQNKVRLVKRENPRDSVVIKPNDVGDKNIFERYLILTREVFDVTGRADQEVYLGIMSPNPQTAGEWQTSDCLNLTALPELTKLRARIVEIQRRNNGLAAFRTADELWKRLFDTSVADHERCRIVRISEPIYSEAAVKKPCD